VDVSLSLLASAKMLKDRARVHFHAYTSETIAEVRLYGTKQLKPGENAFAQLRMNEPLLLLPADRFILRQFSPVITIGGGMVLDAMPQPRAKKDDVQSFLQALAESNPETALKARVVRRSDRGLSISEAVAESGLRPPVIERYLSRSLEKAEILRIGNHLIYAPVFEALKLQLTAAVDRFHKNNRLVARISRKELENSVAAEADIFSAALESLVKAKQIEVVGELVHLPQRGVVMKDEEAESQKMIEQAFASAGLAVPSLKDVLAGLKVDRTRAQKIMTLLLRDKVLIKVSDDLVFHRNALARLREQLAEQKAKSPNIDVAQFKELTGVSRKYAIPLLEYLDRERVTRRLGDHRVIL
jgi:selenocysteine-specific elongation factor